MNEKYNSPLYCNISNNNVTNHYYHSLEHLLMVAQDISQTRSLEKIIQIALNVARKITNCDGATFVLLDHGFRRAHASPSGTSTPSDDVLLEL